MDRAAQAADSDPVIVWEPQPGPQTAFVTCPVFEVVYGGARGGGKTDGVLGDWLNHAATYGIYAKGLMVRRSREQLKDTISRAQEIYTQLGATWKEQDKEFHMPNGAVLRMAYLENDRDAENYQGHSYTRLYIEELTNFPSPRPVMKLKATLRSARGVKVGFRATCNPGGPGHAWVKARYIDPDPRGYDVITDEDGLERVFIPAKLNDNPALIESDPQYVARLKQTGSAALVKAWLEGDWNVIEGAFFDAFQTAKHVIEPFEIPSTWLRFVAFDEGYAVPFSVGWWAVASDNTLLDDGRVIQRGCMVRYREWYGQTGEPNNGLRLTAEQIAQGILDREGNEVIGYRVADPAIFASAPRALGPSIAERMAMRHVIFRRGDNARITQRGAMNGWDSVRSRLAGDEEGNPMLVVFDTCKDWIRTVPILQHDINRPEDLDTEGEDHAADETRYACASRPYIKKLPQQKPKGKTLQNMTLNDLWKAQRPTERRI